MPGCPGAQNGALPVRLAGPRSLHTTAPGGEGGGDAAQRHGQHANGQCRGRPTLVDVTARDEGSAPANPDIAPKKAGHRSGHQGLARASHRAPVGADLA